LRVAARNPGMCARVWGLAIACGFVSVAWPPIVEAGAQTSHARPRASGGAGLLVALEQAPAVLVGEVVRVEKIDLHGYSASVRVGRVLVGQPAPGSVVTIAWEELAPSRQPRFGAGERVLLALTRLPGASLWSRRFPQPGSRARVFAVAADGNAFLRRPTPAAVDLLEHFLRLRPRDRDGPAGVAYLVQLLAGAEIPMSLAAAARLDRVSALDDELEPSGADAIVRSLLRPDASRALIARVLDLVEDHRLQSLRAPLEAMSRASPLAPPVVFVALGLVVGELPPDVTKRLLDGDAADRAVAARFARGKDARPQLVELAISDADPNVRANAIQRLVVLEGEDAIGSALRSLDDADPAVRVAAARALATLGADAVGPLQSVVDNGSVEAARAAVAGLEATGVDGQAALAQIAVHHRDAGVRTLARVALGGSLDTHHEVNDSKR